MIKEIYFGQLLVEDEFGLVVVVNIDGYYRDIWELGDFSSLVLELYMGFIEEYYD